MIRARLAGWLRRAADWLAPPVAPKLKQSDPLVITINADTRQFDAAMGEAIVQLREFERAAKSAISASDALRKPAKSPAKRITTDASGERTEWDYARETSVGLPPAKPAKRTTKGKPCTP